MSSLGQSSISQSGANTCQSVYAISLRGQQKVDKIQVEIKLGAQVDRCNTGEENGAQMLML